MSYTLSSLILTGFEIIKWKWRYVRTVELHVFNYYHGLRNANAARENKMKQKVSLEFRER
jgi:hypothetical protein